MKGLDGRGRITADLVRQRLGPVDGSPPSFQVDPDVGDGFLKAASVLSYFEPEQIQPVGTAVPERGRHVALQQLLDQSRLVRDDQNRLRWMLDDATRRKTLARMRRPEDLRRALDANPERSPDSLQRAIEAYITNEARPLHEQTRLQLQATGLVSRWFDGLLDNLPASAETERELQMSRLLEPFEKLVEDGFVGRTEDLHRLHDYVGVIPPDSARRSLERAIRALWTRREPLVLWGPGGIGKSTLIARFILDHIALEPDERLPFIYLNFDRPQVTIEEPLTLALEGCRQIELQRPELRSQAAGVAQRLRDTIATTRHRRNLEFASDEKEDLLRSRALGELHELLEQATPEGRPLLLVFDTFEEAQYHGPQLLNELGRFLSDLQEGVPRLRVVIGGRSPVTEFPASNERIGDLAPDEARELVERRLGEAATPDLADAVLRNAGGNPLSLKLAVGVVQKLGIEGLEGVRTWYDLLIPWKSSRIQGRLYHRYLDHIHDHEVRKLAHPGLVLRRITPELIRDVLAEPCGVPIPDDARALELFEGLAKEATLVVYDDGELVHRADVRMQMLEDILEADPEGTRDIHARAAEFYRQRGDGDGRDRAEEIYHRLWLPETFETFERRKRLDSLWRDDVGPLLAGATDEVPPVAQVWLRSRLGLPIDRSVRRRADLETWERAAIRSARDAIDDGRPRDALAILREREERSGDAEIVRLEAEALELDRRPQEASEALARGIDRARVSGNVRSYTTLSLASARRLEHRGAHSDALGIIDRCRRDVAGAATRIESLELDASWLRLHRVLGDAPEETARVRTSLQRCFGMTPTSDLRRAPEVVRQVAAELGDRPQMLSRALRIVGIGPLDELEARPLARALETWDRSLRGANPRGEIAAAARVADFSGWLSLLTNPRPALVGQLIWQLLERFEPSEAVVDALVQLYRDAVAPSESRTRSRRSTRQLPS